MENFIVCTVMDGRKAHADLQPTLEIAIDEVLYLYWVGVHAGPDGGGAVTKAFMLDTRYDLPGLAQAFRLPGGNPYIGACPTCCQPGLRYGSKVVYPCELSVRARARGRAAALARCVCA